MAGSKPTPKLPKFPNILKPLDIHPWISLAAFIVLFVAAGLYVVERSQAATAPPTSAACQNYIYTEALANNKVPCVKAIQEMLNGIHAWEPGIFQGAAYLTTDGSFGPLTARAVSNFQASRTTTTHPIPVGGTVGPQTWPLLCLAADEVLAAPANVKTVYLRQTIAGVTYSRCGR